LVTSMSSGLVIERREALLREAMVSRWIEAGFLGGRRGGGVETVEERHERVKFEKTL
jgi:hypothetical protein